MAAQIDINELHWLLDIVQNIDVGVVVLDLDYRIEVYTPAAALALNERGNELHQRLNTLCQRHEVPMQFTGLGSMMTVHMTDATIRSPIDAAQGNPHLKELFFYDLLASGIWLARRGMINLSLPIGAGECDALVEAVEQFIERRLTAL